MLLYKSVSMNVRKISSFAYKTIKAGIAACLVPVFLIYIFLDKPDYKVMNAISSIVLPVAHAVGDAASWPLRALGNLGTGIRDIASAKRENKELRTKLDELSRTGAECQVLVAENQKLEQQLDIVRDKPEKTIVAHILHDNTAFHHSGFVLNKGENEGIHEKMVVVSFDGSLAGIVDMTTDEFASVRSLSDSKSDIPVRIAGTGVYGFLGGAGGNMATLRFFSDPEFMPTDGTKPVSSGINGVLPDGIPVGVIEKSDKKSARVRLFSPAKKLSDAIVLVFTKKNSYK